MLQTFIWILLAVLYFVVFVVLGLTTLRNGHYILFFFVIVFPLLWVIGAILGPTPRAEGAP